MATEDYDTKLRLSFHARISITEETADSGRRCEAGQGTENDELSRHCASSRRNPGPGSSAWQRRASRHRKRTAARDCEAINGLIEKAMKSSQEFPQGLVSEPASVACDRRRAYEMARTRTIVEWAKAVGADDCARG